MELHLQDGRHTWIDSSFPEFPFRKSPIAVDIKIEIPQTLVGKNPNPGCLTGFHDPGC